MEYTRRLICFLVNFFSKDSLKYILAERFQKIDLGLGVIYVGAKVTQLAAVGVGASPHATWPTTSSWR
jgi:hypothetical protein